ncbi:SDR family NAD(P)-dependent oxidoreductase [Microlunatus capsulatus]|uniref:NAD(P)-dependent dehydrogenase (Short-subunit alcohol dehydrogenase family) n=1 Tax=Microlunatus capsulatus TaxID=99117 RepID=A0ABS4Z4I0_9ACTN|nr:SDR family NAD(P)-dependent oxidoreductase [Microlunatus capsulatus]MBP2415958.1 NAD(P)-dependent dehydrogenase (short-subunit alcohol dehydrogenase family) [Microlunatus capsulatus]
MPPAPVLPDLADRTVLVTGANAGLGYFATEQLAAAGARVLMACRSAERADRAVAAVRARVPDARLDVLSLDLADLDSVAACARSVDVGLDAVLCNAGLTSTDGRATTAQGLELMMGGNAFAHLALVAGLADRLRSGARVVSVGSIASRWSPVDLDDLQAERDFRSFRQYGRSKTATTALAFTLDRRWRAAGRDAVALAAHPGFAVDVLTPARPGVVEPSPRARSLARPARLLVQGKDAGAWPLVHACVGAGVHGGEYWGPGGVQELVGPPAPARARDHVRDVATGERLWAAVERATGVSLDALA